MSGTAGQIHKTCRGHTHLLNDRLLLPLKNSDTRVRLGCCVVSARQRPHGTERASFFFKEHEPVAIQTRTERVLPADGPLWGVWEFKYSMLTECRDWRGARVAQCLAGELRFSPARTFSPFDLICRNLLKSWVNNLKCTLVNYSAILVNNNLERSLWEGERVCNNLILTSNQTNLL